MSRPQGCLWGGKRELSKTYGSVTMNSVGSEVSLRRYSDCMCFRRSCLSLASRTTTAVISIVSLKLARCEIGIHCSGSRKEARVGLMASRSSAPYEKQKIASRMVVLPLSFRPIKVITPPLTGSVIFSIPLKFLKLNSLYRNVPLYPFLPPLHSTCNIVRRVNGLHPAPHL